MANDIGLFQDYFLFPFFISFCLNTISHFPWNQSIDIYEWKEEEITFSNASTNSDSFGHETTQYKGEQLYGFVPKIGDQM